MPAGRAGVMAKPSVPTTASLYNQILTLGPKGYWPLRETSGITVVDASGFGRNGTYSGVLTLNNKPGFDGFNYPLFTTSGVGTIPHNADFVGTSGMTFMALVWADAAGAWTVASKVGATGTALEKDWAFYSPNGTDIYAETYTAAGAVARQTYTVNPISIQRSNWNLMTFSVSGTTAYPIVYANGLKLAVGAAPGFMTNAFTGTWTSKAFSLTIGQNPGSAHQTDGYIAHVALFQRVLTDVEIRAVFTSAVTEGWLFSPAQVQPVTYSLTSVADSEVIDALTLTDVVDTEPITYTLSTNTATPAVILDGTLPAAVIGLSPVGYWKLYDSASPPQDSSGNARHASATTNITYDSVPGGGPGLYPTIPNNGQIPVSDNNVWTPGVGGMTVFFIARPTTLVSNRVFVAKMFGSNNEWYIDQFGGQLIASIYGGAGTNTNIRNTQSPAGTVVANVWQAFCVTFSGNTDAATITLYKNSNTPIAGTTTASGGAGTVANGTGVLGLGYRQDSPGGGTALTGSLAHVAIFTGVLSGTDIGTLMSAADADGWF